MIKMHSSVIVFLIILALLSSATFVSAQETGVVSELQDAGAIGNAQSAGGSASAQPAVSGFANCVGGDLGKLTKDFARCDRFRATFEKYWKETGLADKGVDLLFIYLMAKGESGCQTKYAGDPNPTEGGIMQATNDCPEKCSSLDDEIRYGMAEIAANVEKLEKWGSPKGRDGSWMLMYSYNRGAGAAKAAITQLNTGKPIQAAIQDSCFEVYGSVKNQFCYDGTDSTPNIASRYHCSGSEWNSVCDNGKTCRQWSGCFLNPSDMPIGIHYVGSRWPMYVSACEGIGGTISEKGSLIEVTQPTTATGEEAPEELAPPGYRPVHPYFTVPYSINPSFSVTVPYDFSVYDKVSSDIKGLERCLDDIDCIVEGVSAIEQASEDTNWVVQYGGNIISSDENGVPENFIWETYCEKPSVHAVNSLAEAIDNCANSADRECVCKYSLPVVSSSSLLGDAWGAYAGGEDDVARLLGATMFAMSESEELSKWESRELSFDKVASGLKIGLNAITLEEGASTPSYTVGIQLVRGVWLNKVDSDIQGETPRSLLYSKDQAGNSLDIYKERSGNISIYAEGESPNIRECEVHDKMLKFCIVRNQSVLSYDYNSNRMGLQQLVLRFAYLFRSKVTDVSNFRVLDARLLSNTSLLIWDPVVGVDTALYTLYYSPDVAVKATLGSQSPADVDEESLGITAIELPNDEYSIQPVEMTIDSLLNPSFDLSSSPPERIYALETATGVDSTTTLEPGVLYFSNPDRKFFYLLPDVANDQDYFFAVTATDRLGEESPSFNTPVESEESVDDVPPSLVSVESASIEGESLVLDVGAVTNMDGSFLDTALLNDFTLYCFVDYANLDLSTRYRFYPEREEALEGGKTRLYVSISDINEVNCYTERNPQSVMLVVAGSKKSAEAEEYRGPITEDVLSAPITVR